MNGGKMTQQFVQGKPEPVNPETVARLKELEEQKKRAEHLQRLADVDAGKIKGKKLTSVGYNILSAHRQQQAAAGALSAPAAKAIAAAAAKREKKRSKLKGGESNG